MNNFSCWMRNCTIGKWRLHEFPRVDGVQFNVSESEKKSCFGKLLITFPTAKQIIILTSLKLHANHSLFALPLLIHYAFDSISKHEVNQSLEKSSSIGKHTIRRWILEWIEMTKCFSSLVVRVTSGGRWGEGGACTESFNVGQSWVGGEAGKKNIRGNRSKALGKWTSPRPGSFSVCCTKQIFVAKKLRERERKRLKASPCES